MKAFDMLMEAVFPSNIYCICCGAVIDRSRPYALCDSCIEKFHWLGHRTCSKCGKILDEDYLHERCHDCRQTEHVFDRGFTCAQYGLYERAVIMDYKYRDRSWIGKKLGDILADRMRLEDIRYDIIIPVPIHASREKARGYNQASVMADRVGRITGHAVRKDVLVRSKATAPMKDLNISERAENLKGAFKVCRGREKDIAGKDILLIDDIYTTGATADSCCTVLKAGGAEKVYFLTFAAGGNVITGNRI